MSNMREVPSRAIERELETRNWRLIQRRPAQAAPLSFVALLHWISRLFSDWGYRFRAALTLPSVESADFEQLKRSGQDRARLAHEYSQGYIAGWRECFDACLEAVEDEFASREEIWRQGASLTGRARSQRDN